MMQLKRRHRILIVFFLFIILLVSIDQIWVALDRHITISPATTYITSPLTPDGYPDYVGVLNTDPSKGVTADNNAVPVVLEIAGTTPETADWVNHVTREMHLAPIEHPAFFKTYLQWCDEHPSPPTTEATANPEAIDPIRAIDEESERSWQSPWSPAEHPRLAAWLADQKPVIDQFVDASAKEHFYYPIVAGAGTGSSLMAIPNVPLSSTRSLARMLLARAQMHLAQNRPDEFRRDFLASARAARLVAQRPSLLEWLVATGIDSASSKALQGAALSGRLDKSHAEQLLLDLDAFPPIPAASAAVGRFERFFVLDGICLVHRKVNVASSTSDIATLSAILPINYDRALTLANTYFDREVAALELPDFAARDAALKAVENDIQALNSASTLSKLLHIDQMLLTILMPPVGPRVNSLMTVGWTEHELGRLGLALHVHRLQTGIYPANLSELRLPLKITADPFTNQPLIYHQTPKGYILYSVGPDLHDNGGTPRPKDAPAKSEYDLVVGTELQN